MLSYTLFHLLVDPGLGVIIFSIVDMVVSAVVVVWNQLRYNGKEMVRLHVVDVVVVVNDGSSLVSVKSSLPTRAAFRFPLTNTAPGRVVTLPTVVDVPSRPFLWKRDWLSWDDVTFPPPCGSEE